MSKIPKITIVQDLDKEVGIFLKFLNHPEFPQKRLDILRVHQGLSATVGKQNEKLTVREFIQSCYQENALLINKIINESKESLTRSQEALKQLGILMEYKWPDATTYIARPTILPFSPFRDNEFFFSILNCLFKNKPADVLDVAVHEISHFVFFNQLKDVEQKNQIKFNRDLIYYYKESLTTVILNQEELKSCLRREFVLGNPNIRDINVKKGDQIMSLINYLTNEFETKENYGDFLEKTLLKLNKSNSDFVKKREFWDKNGQNIFESEKLLEKYKTPIDLHQD